MPGWHGSGETDHTVTRSTFELPVHRTHRESAMMTGNRVNKTCLNRDLPDVQAGFRKGRGTGDQIANICWTLKEQESSRKTSISALLTMPSILRLYIVILLI